MINYDKSPTQTWKRPTTWNPSPQKRFLSSPLFKCSTTTRLKTQRGVPTLTHQNGQRGRVDETRRDLSPGQNMGETTVTPTAVNFQKKLRLKNHLPALLQGSSYHPSKIIFEGEVYENQQVLDSAASSRVKVTRHSLLRKDAQ